MLAGADLSQFSLSEMGTRVVDAMIEVIQDEEVRRVACLTRTARVDRRSMDPSAYADTCCGQQGG